MQDENADPALRSAPDVPVKPISGEDIYAEEIIDYLMAHNSVPSDDYNYFNGQPDITEHMRCVLLNWLVDVHLKYRLKADTFFLTVAIIDSFLSKISVNRNELQLVGITALWIAAKYEETYQVPKVNNLVFICDSTYQLKEIL